MKRVEGIIRPDRLGEVASLLESCGLTGFTMFDARGHGQLIRKGEYRGQSFEMLVNHKLMIVVFVEDDEVEMAVRAIVGGAATGAVGDGLVGVSDIAEMYRVSMMAPVVS